MHHQIKQAIANRQAVRTLVPSPSWQQFPTTLRFTLTRSSSTLSAPTCRGGLFRVESVSGFSGINPEHSLHMKRSLFSVCAKRTCCGGHPSVQTQSHPKALRPGLIMDHSALQRPSSAPPANSLELYPPTHTMVAAATFDRRPRLTLPATKLS